MKRRPQILIVLLGLIGVLLIGGLTACQPQGQPTDDANATSATNTEEQTPEETANESVAEAANTETEDQASSDSASSNEVASESEVAVAPKLNLNEASGDDFLTVPDVGNRMVREFLEYRPYISIQQFRREMGKYIDDAQITAYEQYVFVPIDVDESDAATLQQIPEVDEAIAETLIAGRPYGSTETFLTELGAHISEDALAIAETYLMAK